MKRWLPVLALFAGLGSSFSSAQVVPPKDPFARYVAGVRTGLQEPSLRRFAAGCGVDISRIQLRYAVGPGSSFIQVKDLPKGMQRLDTDFYSTAEVWPTADRVLVEIWANSDDVGSEARYYKCFVNRKLTQAELIVWTVPVVQAPGVVPWGYSRRWERDTNERMQKTKAEFVDEIEQPMPKPKLDADDEKSLHWIPPLGSLNELMLPPSLLR
jgi:hypothetical protein